MSAAGEEISTSKYCSSGPAASIKRELSQATAEAGICRCRLTIEDGFFYQF